jgi:hypothetical protein
MRRISSVKKQGTTLSGNFFDHREPVTYEGDVSV